MMPASADIIKAKNLLEELQFGMAQGTLSRSQEKNLVDAICLLMRCQ